MVLYVFKLLFHSFHFILSTVLTVCGRVCRSARPREGLVASRNRSRNGLIDPLRSAAGSLQRTAAELPSRREPGNAAGAKPQAVSRTVHGSGNPKPHAKRRAASSTAGFVSPSADREPPRTTACGNRRPHCGTTAAPCFRRCCGRGSAPSVPYAPSCPVSARRAR